MSRALIASAALIGIATPAMASLTVRIDKSRQRVIVSRDGEVLHRWRVSTGRIGLETPNGVYSPKRLARRWHSRKYDDAPMPYSIFFHGGYAIHGSYEVGQLGEPASHGCVRLTPRHAAELFALVRSEGVDDTQIIVTGRTPGVLEADDSVPPRRARPPERVPINPFEGLPPRWPRPPVPNSDYGFWPWQNGG